MADIRWYVVHTYSGYENKVKTNIEQTIINRQLEEQIREVRVPVEEVTEIKNGVKKKISRKVYPGYVLVNMEMNDDTWYVVRNTRGVTGFVGPGSKPVPLTEEEVQKYLGDKESTEDVEVNFAEGDLITVISGAWENTEGVIKKIDTKKQTVTINVDMFGRETPVEINFSDVKVVK
ncbi:MAG: transcription termination/antitermination factor NusG [Lachnospiraceae bacterium]|nr:transcription termination/antitermination factor NusG [Lachnospiraceae bacterium]